MTDKQLTVRIDARDQASADLRQFNRNLRQTGETATRTSKSMGGLKVAVASALAAFSVRQVAGFAKELFELGAAVGETESKFRTVFGGATSAMNEFVDSFATMAGLTQREAKDVVATMAAIGQGMGQSKAESAEFSESVVRLAGDLASFNNVPIRDTLRDIQSGLAGQVEPLRKYGIELDARAVDLTALKQTGKSLGDELTNQEKLLGRLELAYQRAGVQVGDLERTQDSAANVARQLAAEFGNIKDEVATAMLPVLSEMLPVLREIGEAIAEQVPQWADLISVAADLFGVIDRSVLELQKNFETLNLNLLETALNQAVAAQTDLLAELNTATEGLSVAESNLVDELTRREFVTKQTAVAVDAAAAGIKGIKAELAEWTERERLLRAEIAKRQQVQSAGGTGSGGGLPPSVSGSGGLASPPASDLSRQGVPVLDFTPMPEMFGLASASEGASEYARVYYDSLAESMREMGRLTAPELESAIADPMAEFGQTLVADFQQLGADLVTGLMSGTGNAGEMLKRFMLSFTAKFILGPLSGALGIASPSKVTAGYGRDLGAGLQIGMDAAGPAVATSARALADTAISAFDDLPPITIDQAVDFEISVPPVDVTPEIRLIAPPLELAPTIDVVPRVAFDHSSLRQTMMTGLDTAFAEPLELPALRFADSAAVQAPTPRPLSGTADMIGRSAPTLRIDGLPDERANPFSPWILRWLSDAQIQVELNRG